MNIQLQHHLTCQSSWHKCPAVSLPDQCCLIDPQMYAPMCLWKGNSMRSDGCFYLIFSRKLGPTLTTTHSLTSLVSSSNWNCIPAQLAPAVACMCFTEFYDHSFSIMALLLLHLILAEECLCKIVKFLMTPQEDDYKLCPTCRGYNVIKRNSLRAKPRLNVRHSPSASLSRAGLTAESPGCLEKIGCQAN